MLGLRINLGKTKVIVRSRITKDGLSKHKTDPCEVCSLKVKAYSVLCVQCGKWIHRRCDGVKRVMPKLSEILYMENVKGILERQWSRKKSYVMKWKL